jgi:predicted transposase YbfD/YdcC
MNDKVSKFIELFENMPDERQEWKVKHKLVDIIFIAVTATIADCDDWEEIEWFAKLKENWLRKYLELPNGIPSHDTIERVFAWLDPVLFREKFLEWLGLAMNDSKKGIIAIDGKTMRGSRDGKRSPLHVVNAWFSENKMFLSQVFTGEKDNEITAIPELLDILSVTGHIVTIDAMGTQKDIVSKIIDKGGDYVLALKQNHPNLFEDVKLFFDKELNASGEIEHGILSHSKREKGHGRIEYRQYYITDQIPWLTQKKEWENLTSIGMVRCRTENLKTGAKTDETRYFITSLTADVHRFAYAVRSHWGIENAHWSLDTTFNEDGRRSRKNNSAKNLSQLLRLAYDIIKASGVPKGTPLKRLRKDALVKDKYLEKLVSHVFVS